MTDSDVVSVAASGEGQGEFEEEAASVGAEVSVIVEPEPDTPIYHRPKVAKRHGSQTGTRDIADPHQFDIRGAVEATVPVKITMPWETGAIAHALGLDIAPYKPLTMTRVPSPIPPMPDRADASKPKFSLSGHTKLKAARSGPPEDDRVRAIHRFKVLVLLDPLSTRAGRQMTDLAGLCSDDARALDVLNDILAPKSTGTLVKRSGALWRYAAFLSTRGSDSPFSAGEEQLYQYLRSLKTEGCTSTASSLLKALRFANALLVFTKITIAELDSPRVKGAAHAMFVTKRARSQAPPIPVEVVKMLVMHAADPLEEPHISLIAGQLLQCVFGAGRWSDFRRAGSLEVDDSDGTVVWSVWTADHKTAISKEAKTRLLPFIGLGHWPGLGNWIGNVATNREAEGIVTGLPSWNEAAAQWNPWPMSSSEATAWLREFAERQIGADRARTLRSHSCKHTLLTWAGGSGLFTREERTMLGHHVEAATKSAATYDHNAMLAIHVKVLKMLQMIAEGSYRPDDSPAARMKAMAESAAPSASQPVDTKTGAGKGDGSSSSDDEGEPKEIIQVQREPLPEDAEAHSWYRHSVSGIVHISLDAQGQRLRCGRQVSCNFEPVEPAELDRFQCLFCVQCSRSQEPAHDA